MTRAIADTDARRVIAELTERCQDVSNGACPADRSYEYAAACWRYIRA